MKKEMLFAFTLISLLVFSSFVYAAGGSTIDEGDGDTDTSPNDGSELDIQETDDADSEEVTLTNCDTLSSRKNRIKCRLKKIRDSGEDELGESSEESGGLYEACKNRIATSNIKMTRERCQQFYDEIRPCYKETGRTRVACFRRASGLGTASVSGNTDKTHIREYTIALLYDLQQSIERENNRGTVTDEDAAEAIDLIVEIKQDIREGEPRNEIRPKLARLREMLKTLRTSRATQ